MSRASALRGFAIAAVGCALLASCASRGGELRPDACDVDVLGVEKWDMTPRGPDIAYRIRGEAGSQGVVWLAAQSPNGSYVSGHGVQVGPGPFQAVVDLKLDRLPEAFVVVLEVAGRRCKADAPKA